MKIAILFEGNPKKPGGFYQSLQSASILNEIDGIGPTRRKQLLKHFKTFGAIKVASLEELENVLPESVAKNVVQFFHGEKNEGE